MIPLIATRIWEGTMKHQLYKRTSRIAPRSILPRYLPPCDSTPVLYLSIELERDESLGLPVDKKVWIYRWHMEDKRWRVNNILRGLSGKEFVPIAPLEFTVLTGEVGKIEDLSGFPKV